MQQQGFELPEDAPVVQIASGIKRLCEIWKNKLHVIMLNCGSHVLHEWR